MAGAKELLIRHRTLEFCCAELQPNPGNSGSHDNTLFSAALWHPTLHMAALSLAFLYYRIHSFQGKERQREFLIILFNFLCSSTRLESC